MNEIKKTKELADASRELLASKKEVESAKYWLKATSTNNDELRRRRTLSLEQANKKLEKAQAKYNRLV